MRLSDILQRFAGKFPILTCDTELLKVLEGPTLLSARRQSFPLDLLGIRVAFHAMRDVEPPYLGHNQMASYFEALCVLIDGPAQGFLHTNTNLWPFAKDFRGEGQLHEYIGDFSRVLLRRD